MPKAKILVVEDEYLVGTALKITLIRLGYEVTSIVSTGKEAIEKAEKEKPDLILMDIVLEGEMDGIEAANEIYSRFKIPVIYVTAHADIMTRERADSANPFGYLIKPYKDEELDKIILKAL